jgi:hypothetical protein
MYLALKRKPNNSGKIQNLTNVALGIMLCLKVMKSANKEKAIAAATATTITAPPKKGERGRRLFWS